MEAVARMQEDVSRLRDESVLTSLGGDNIDMQLQLASLRAGISRLSEGRLRANARNNEIRKAAVGRLEEDILN